MDVKRLPVTLDSEDQAELAVFGDPERLESDILKRWAQQHHITVRDNSESGIARALLRAGLSPCGKRLSKLVMRGSPRSRLRVVKTGVLIVSGTRTGSIARTPNDDGIAWTDFLGRYGVWREAVGRRLQQPSKPQPEHSAGRSNHHHPKPGIPTAVPLGSNDPLVGSILADDLAQLFDDELKASRSGGALSPSTTVELNKALAIALALP